MRTPSTSAARPTPQAATSPVPNPLRARYRLQLQAVVQTVVGDKVPLAHALDVLGYTVVATPGLADIARDELTHLCDYNCARYRLTPEVTRTWVAAGRPY